jgi:hypothetical protein
MIAERIVLCAVFAVAVGCSGAKESGGQPSSQNDWRDRKTLAEMRAKAEVLKEDLRRLQRELNAKDPQKSASPASGEKEWRPHADYLGDSKYLAIYNELSRIVEAHNSILDQNPTWNMPRLDVKLE